ncbi:MAG: IS66 family transposase [bacterium]
MVKPPLQETVKQLQQQNEVLQQTVVQLEHQLNWFKRQLFGSTSERHHVIQDIHQQDLFVNPNQTSEEPPEAFTSVEAHQRRKEKDRQNSVQDKGLRFDETVPVKVIDQTPNGINEADIVRYESTFRLAQRPGSYLILEYRCPIIKDKTNRSLIQVPAPSNVLEKTVVDVSFLAGMLVDKFAYHLPLYRQHQRLKEAGITVARSSLTNWCTSAALLLEPIVQAQMNSLLQSHVVGMDEVPIKAGRKPKKAKQARGSMKQGYLWPMYGDKDEVVFHYDNTRGFQVVEDKLRADFEGILLSDGYSAYTLYCENKDKVTLANCWAHTRRYFEKVLDIDPPAAQTALKMIQKLYKVERDIREKQLTEKDKLDHRTQYSEPIVKQFWQWCEQQKERPDLFPKHPLMTALNYALARVEPLKVFLSDPQVPLDTNHVERCLRPIPMGRKNWLFCWTEMGARHVATIQSLIVTCRLHQVHPYQYLVDVLQRVGSHPASEVELLTPRLWKEHFADRPMLSDVSIGINDGVV